ncbi:hypothetical protein [Hufsiella ginkgonis]|uniref:Anti-sigma factor n=1 Tax=Hufsiella ginkgonis TaxID=2695274 RepID=A0A7K1XSX1_9SPHI|nr:hypothetical protein [Hufsiella ginkgonis]MXV13977.1 hypothetical protein [Hufsiella ginkgonis]
MSEKFEKFIRSNRREFDECEPPVGLWERIEQQLDKKQQVKKARMVRLSFVVRVAAALLVVLTAGVLFLKHGNNSIDISSVSPEMGKLQVQYASMIEDKQQELKRIEKEDPQLYREFASEIAKMDTNYQKLQNDLATSPNREETVKAMIRNLQTQIDVLNQQLTIIQQINQIKKGQTHETQSI